jgi:hypothetical protein
MTQNGRGAPTYANVPPGEQLRLELLRSLGSLGRIAWPHGNVTGITSLSVELAVSLKAQNRAIAGPPNL